jgi:DNA repair exonuclease SbcCD ATPase subunit
VLIFKTVSWKNFLSTGNNANELILDKDASTLVVGKNGEGKSTMLDALTFALFGKPFRDINKNQLINSINKKNCLVEVVFELNGRTYKIVRGIKPNVFEIYCNGDLVNQDAALKDYQKVLEQQILRLNYKTFTQVIILGSSSFVPFMQLPSGQRREVIEDILDIRVFSVMNQLLKEKMLDTKDSITRIDSKVSQERIKIEAQKTIIQTMVTNKNEVVAGLELKIEEVNTQTELAQAKIEVLSTEIADLQLKIAKKDTITTGIKEAEKVKTKIASRVETYEQDLEFFENNTTCPTCAQEIDGNHAHIHTDNLLNTIRESSDKLTELDTVLTKLNEQMDVITKINDQISTKNIEVATYNNTVTILNKQYSALKKEIETAQANTGDIDAEKAKLKDLAGAALELVVQKNNLHEHRNLQDAASALLKDTGIKTAIIREYLPVMNKFINKYLTAMDFFVHFELDESFNEIIKSRHRDEFTYASFSEGEKMRIDLAILFTWRQIAKMKNSVNTNLLILDEVFDSSLDTTGTDYFLSIMNTFGENSNVFVISHKGDQLIDKFENTIKFEKKNEFSVISSN